MRVLLNGWFWHQPGTGSGQYIRRLVAALAPASPQITYGILVPDVPEAYDPTHDAPNVTLIPLPAGDRRGGRVGRALRKLWWEQSVVPRAARRWKADVLHVPYWAPPMRSPVPAVVTVHDLIPVALPAYRRRVDVRLYTSLVSAATSGAAALIADSEATRRDLLDYLHVDPARVRRVYLAVDARYRPPGAETDAAADAAVLRDLGVGAGYVLYLGGFDVRKNLAVLLAAFAYVRRVLPVDLVVAGRLPDADTTFTPDPRRLAREAGLDEGGVRFTGYVPEDAKPALYRGARAFLFPSRYEGFGLPPLEALACGVPVVGSDATSLPEVVGDAGVLTPPDDAPGMAGGILHLLSDEAFHTSMRRRALRQAARFSWTETAQQTVEVYHEIVGASARI
jgi:glycosyltransferase involved in cell wall biosynthesis